MERCGERFLQDYFVLGVGRLGDWLGGMYMGGTVVGRSVSDGPKLLSGRCVLRSPCWAMGRAIISGFPCLETVILNSTFPFTSTMHPDDFDCSVHPKFKGRMGHSMTESSRHLKTTN